MKEYSIKAQMVIDALSEDELKQIKKDNLFRYERNAKIKELCERGVEQIIVAEISGLSKNSIARIRHGSKRKHGKN
jgi:ferredoxin-fold anticodon binding domain-containing protein